MAITKVRVKLNGSWTNLTKNDAGKWTGSITAPATTSFNLSGGYYPVTVEATNDAGTVKTWEATDATLGQMLRLVVKETIKPSVVLVSPADDSYITNNKHAVTFKVTDEAGGSGIKLADVKLKIDGNSYTYNSTGMTYEAITNGYQFVFTPQSVLADGIHTITIDAKDNDGNAATTVTANITVDTTPPTLNVSSPAEGYVTNKAALNVAGTTNDSTSSPVVISIKLNGTDQGTVTVGSNGSFSKSVTLKEGENTIQVVAKDAAGKTSTVSRTVKLDTTVPAIASVTLSPNPVNASKSVTITIEVS